MVYPALLAQPSGNFFFSPFRHTVAHLVANSRHESRKERTCSPDSSLRSPPLIPLTVVNCKRVRERADEFSRLVHSRAYPAREIAWEIPRALNVSREHRINGVPLPMTTRRRAEMKFYIIQRCSLLFPFHVYLTFSFGEVRSTARVLVIKPFAKYNHFPRYTQEVSKSMGNRRMDGWDNVPRDNAKELYLRLSNVIDFFIQNSRDVTFFWFVRAKIFAPKNPT